MDSPNIETTYAVVPMCYGYSTPEIKRHEGWTKIGYTEKDVTERIKEQTRTADVEFHEEWRGNATFDDGSGETFTDHHFHGYLRKQGVEQEPGKDNEWFHIDGEESEKEFNTFRKNRGILKELDSVVAYQLRKEQEQAVSTTLQYFKNHPGGSFLWNAKPRFGKTLTSYDLVKRGKFESVLIVTNRPVVSTSWYDDYAKFLGPQSDYVFVSDDKNVKNKKACVSTADWPNARKRIGEDKAKLIRFVSLQDLKGSDYFGGKKNKLHDIYREDSDNNWWDLLIIDECHEGVDTYKTDLAFDHLKRKFTLNLSGTPFKALADGRFNDDAIFNWTYADEQEAKLECSKTQPNNNPYDDLPKLTLYSYQMSEMILEDVQKGVQINDESYDYVFDLNEFFRTENGNFVYNASVDKFLDSLTFQDKYPFSSDKLRNELKHTFWLLDRVDSARALARKLKNHPVFKDYQVIFAAGDGKIDDEEQTGKSFEKVIKAIKEFDKTITLSVGQLTTGVTIPQWSAVIMLCNVKSAGLYMQAAFRAQNPCLYNYGNQHNRKLNSYIFDFDPARTLDIYDQFANNLSSGVGNLNADQRRKNINRLLNFFPVIGEDSSGKLVELDAEKVLSIPRKLKSQEVVKRGFMSNYLFNNISNIFSAPAAVREICDKLKAVKEPKNKGVADIPSDNDLYLDKDGNTVIPDEIIIGKNQNIFGKGLYETEEIVDETCESLDFENVKKSQINDLLNKINNQVIDPIIETGGNEFSKSEDFVKNDFNNREKKKIRNTLMASANTRVNKVFDNYKIQKKKIENKRDETLCNRKEGESAEAIEKEVQKKLEELAKLLPEQINSTVSDIAESCKYAVIKTHEENKINRERKTVEDNIRNHLRGFTRTIPAFLMAYGDENVELSNFDKIIPDEVFQEVTSITKDEFRFLRDGGDYKDEETGEIKHFEGHLFDSVVFNDSVKEFMRLKDELCNYFDPNVEQDIFDYIPPQKTNQIFTPKNIVEEMVDNLEQENPGCFDNPDSTFCDLYMKSGLYPAYIVTRLFNSKKMKKLFPDENLRLKHIFENQIYGLAPTEIIYNIAINFILGFADDNEKIKHNFRLCDTLPYAKNGTLEDKINELFDKEVQ